MIEWRSETAFPDLAHATAIAGIGQGRLKKVINQICLTPGPFIALNEDGLPTDYQWIDSGGGVVEATLSAEPFRLEVPPGTIAGSGLWGSIAIQSADEVGVDVPHADFDLYGDWVGEVIAVLPTDSGQLPSSVNVEHVVYHQLGTGQWERFGPGDGVVVDRQAGEVRTSLTSLSPVLTFLTVTYNGAVTGIDWLRGTFVRAPECSSPHTGSRLDVDGTPIDSLLAGGAAIKWCDSYDPSTGKTAVTLRNAYELVVDMDVTSGSAQLQPLKRGDPLFPRLIAAVSSNYALGGEARLEFAPAAGFENNSGYYVIPSQFVAVDVSPDIVATAIAVTGDVFLSDVIKLIEDELPPAVHNVLNAQVYEALECLYTSVAAGTGTIDAVLDQLPGVVLACLTTMITALRGDLDGILADQNVSPVVKAQVEALLKRFGLDLDLLKKTVETKVKTALIIADIGGALRDLASISSAGNGLITFTLEPVTPTTTEDGLRIFGACTSSQNGTIRIDLICVRYLHDLGFRAGDIPLFLGRDSIPNCWADTRDPSCGLETSDGTPTDENTPPSDLECWRWDLLSQSWVWDATNGQRCLIVDGCVRTTNPLVLNRCYPDWMEGIVVEEVDTGRSYYADPETRLLEHIPTTDDYWECRELARVAHPTRDGLTRTYATALSRWVKDDRNIDRC